MARTKKTDGEKPVATRAEKKDATKNIIRELLAVKPYKHNELIEEVARIYTQNFAGDETDNVNDVKGRVGSVLDIMKKESDVAYEGGVYALKARTMPAPAPVAESKTEEEKPVKKATRTRAKKTAETENKATAEEPKKTAKPKTKKIKTEKLTPPEPAKEETEEIERTPLPAGPIQPIAPVAPITPEVAPEPMPETAPKKRGRKAKAEKAEKTEETPAEKPAEKPVEEKAIEEKPVLPVAEEKSESKEESKAVTIVKPAPVAKPTVIDMSFLFGGVKAKKAAPAKAEQAKVEMAKAEEKTAESKTPEKPAPTPAPASKNEEKTAKAEVKAEQMQPQKQEPKKPQPAQAQVRKENKNAPANKRRAPEKPVTADEKLREAFLKRMRTLGGDYFEYYSVYLLERYSMRNGRRLESMKITGGDHDGGIDGEIELTDKFGFRETIYIQSKNWDPDKGDEKLWVVGETLLQQFIGACACRQAKEGKQHCRGIFVTTSRFTPEAKRILDDMSDKIVGYDGADLYEAAKECEFGVVKKNGEWALDDRLLSSAKAFFEMF